MSTRPRNRYQQMVLPWAFILVMASPMGVNATPGPTNPNIHSDYNKLPALEKAKITWDGIPSYMNSSCNQSQKSTKEGKEGHNDHVKPEEIDRWLTFFLVTR